MRSSWSVGSRHPIVLEFVGKLFVGRAEHSPEPRRGSPSVPPSRREFSPAPCRRRASRRDATLLGVETFGGLMNVIIPRNSTIPIKAGEMFTKPWQGNAPCGSGLQGEREMARDNWQLGEFELEFESARSQARVGVQSRSMATESFTFSRET